MQARERQRFTAQHRPSPPQTLCALYGNHRGRGAFLPVAVRGPEFFQFEFDRHQAAQAAMIEEQVEIVIVPADRQALLSGDKSEIRSQLDEKPLQLSQDSCLQILLAIGIFQT